MGFLEVILLAGLFLFLLLFLLEIVLLQHPGRVLFRRYPILTSYSLMPKSDWNRLTESTVDSLEEENGFRFRLDQVNKELLFKVSGYKYPIPYIAMIRWPNPDELLVSIRLRLGQLCLFSWVALSASLGYGRASAGSVIPGRWAAAVLVFFFVGISVFAFYWVKLKRLKAIIVSLDEYFSGQGEPPDPCLL